MEFLPGAFEREWERRRAALLHEMQMSTGEIIVWDEPRRGGVSWHLNERSRGFGHARSLHSDGSRSALARSDAASTGRSMRTRFQALARGSQPAVVKLASYGAGGRAGAMISYVSREGALAVENERGERVLGKDALAEQRAEWGHLFEHRAASRDFAVFHVTIDGLSLPSDTADEQVREILRSGFGDRRFVYGTREATCSAVAVNGVVVLRDQSGERLTGDRKAAAIVQQRFNECKAGLNVEARFRFHGYGNGIAWGTARVRELVVRESHVRDESGRFIEAAPQAGTLVQQEWRKGLHSRKGRDVVHLIVSSRAGTDAWAFQAAVREFLADRFAGHRYVFAVHDPARDPKDIAEGGRRPHVHAHAIVTMRSETGERIETSPRLFRTWRLAMAEKAREQGIDMELTDRRDLASAPAYTRNQVRPVSHRGRTEHEGTTDAARVRYEAKRSNVRTLAGSPRSHAYAATAADVWNGLMSDEQNGRASAFAALQTDRLQTALWSSQSDRFSVAGKDNSAKRNANIALLIEQVGEKEELMQEMTRPQFEAYEERVEAVLASVKQTLDLSDRSDFDEFAAAARAVVDIRRDYLELTERQAETPDAGGGDKGGSNRSPRVAGAGQNRAAGRFLIEQDGDSRQFAGQPRRLRAETTAERSPPTSAQYARSDPQRLDQIERDVQERQNRERDDRER
ncbi:hypothetical protein SAMN04488498_11524 [Mesorhizobium albiziae]|uniref:MobA/VirD2-like nuclease domain-containing protein n=1 Tax=Neomesorhizobium albiziae TaxID=335020 RepID=A0A1I4CZV2_9HYPH|nr:hypothetical protein [Mesorhizobium albiziae]GLS28410.1 hypothetical protein GCM10007937_01170 [Mesorhizobium albiziae]SFK86283.1 hypothetical protein SAMN04488498_11524 [Mesorhizobium albiziae]